MAWVTPTSVSTGDVLQASQWNQDVVANAAELAPFMSAWTSYTPTLTNTTAPITYAKYCKVGKFVAFAVLLTLTGAQVTGRPGITLPVPAVALLSGSFQGLFEDSGSAFYPAFPVLESTTSRVEMYVANASGTYALLNGPTSTVPFVWASGDKITLAGTYEAA